MSKLIDKTSYIYTLSDPTTGDVRYVGWTSQSPEKRLYDHCRCFHGNGSYKKNWVRSLLPYKPVMRVVETLPPNADWVAAEVRWIEFYKNKGCLLTNLTDGGEGSIGYKHSNEVKRLLSERQKGIKRLTAEQYACIGDKLRGRKRPDHVIEAIRVANTGERSHRWGKPAHNKGVPASKETRKKLSDLAKGRVASEETRKKLSEAMKGRPKSKEHNKKVGDALRGRKQSDEAILKLTQSRRDNHKRRILEQGYSVKNKRNTSGHPGISFDKRCNKYEIYATVSKKKVSGGKFATLEEAIMERKKFLDTVLEIVKEQK